MEKGNRYWVIGIFLIACSLQGCAGSSGLAGNSGNERTYQKDYQSMKEVVKQAIRESSLVVVELSEPKGEPRMTVAIAKKGLLDRQSVRQHQGRVIVLGKKKGQTTVEVENPEYHYTVPSYKREDYQRLLFSAIEDKLKE